MVTYFPSQTSSNLMIVIFAQKAFDYGAKNNSLVSVPNINFFEAIRLNVQIFFAFEVRPEVTNILATRRNVLYQQLIYLQKNESFIFKYNIKVFRNSANTYSFFLLIFWI